MINLNIGQIIHKGHYTMVVISIDHHNSEAKFKLFNNKKEAEIWIHDVSKQQHPRWHLENCDICNK